MWFGKETMSDLLSTDQVAELTGVPVATLRYWRHVHTGPKSFKMGPRRIVYKREDVESWLARQYATTAVGG